MGVQSTTGIKLSASAALPASRDLLGYEALAYTLIEELTAIPAFGAETSLITYDVLANEYTSKAKGQINYGSQELVGIYDSEADGQAIMLEAAEGATKRNFITLKLEYPLGEVRYYEVLVMTFKEGGPGANNMIEAAMTAEIGSPILRVPAP